jgi:hypothetical protein
MQKNRHTRAVPSPSRPISHGRDGDADEGVCGGGIASHHLQSIFREEIKAYCVAVRALRERERLRELSMDTDEEDQCANSRALASLTGERFAPLF